MAKPSEAPSKPSEALKKHSEARKKPLEAIRSHPKPSEGECSPARRREEAGDGQSMAINGNQWQSMAINGNHLPVVEKRLAMGW